MTVTVIIPTLNEEQALPATLVHTLGLGFEEILVVDGGSRDRTRDLVGALPSGAAATRLALLGSPPGRAKQMNAGAAASRGDVLLFLHADTRLPEEARSAILQALQDPDCVGGRFDLRFDRDRLVGRMVSGLMNLRSRLSGIATGDQAIFVRRAVFEQLGGFSDIPLMEDVDFTRRLKRAGRRACLPEQVVTSFRRWEVQGPLRTIVLMWLLRLLYWSGVSPAVLARWYAQVR